MNFGNSEDKVAPYRPLSLMIDDRMTDYECDDFIAVWEKFVPGAFCDQLISWFDNKLNQGQVDFHEGEELEETEFGEDTNQDSDSMVAYGEQQYGSNMRRKDKSILVNYANEKITYQVNQFLKSCVGHYIHEFGQLKGVGLFSSDIKMQHTTQGGGYHLWHYENSSGSHAARELTWMIYLNDVDDDAGGETEFLYQHRRIKPTKGTVVVFPAGLTHVHKGNTLLKGDKYIVTGWYIKASI